MAVLQLKYTFSCRYSTIYMMSWAKITSEFVSKITRAKLSGKPWNFQHLHYISYHLLTFIINLYQFLRIIMDLTNGAENIPTKARIGLCGSFIYLPYVRST